MLKDWFDSSGDFNAARVVLLSDWSDWTTILIVLTTVIVIYLGWYNTRGIELTRRRGLTGLRTITITVVWLLFLQPGVRLEHVSRVRNHLVTLIDNSRSMSLPGEMSGGSRIADVRAFMAREADIIESWKADHQVDLYAFSNRTRPITDIKALEAHGDATHLVAALDDISERLDADTLAAVILISDGADTGVLGEMEAGAPLSASVRASIKRLGAPIHTFFTGPRSPPADVAIAEVNYDDFAFVRNAVEIELVVAVSGYGVLDLPVILKRDGRVVGERSLRTRPEQQRYTLNFEFVPDEVGKAVFIIEVGAGSESEIMVNNTRRFVIRIIRDKIRVLQVVGRPSWDERFLRKLVKKNPNVDLISFFILRTNNSIEVARRNELSLIPFPTRELFEEQLGSFDLVIFQNFTFHGYHMRQYLSEIRDYVRNGGGFVMIGGDLSFASGGYARTPIAEFLPVLLPEGRSELIDSERFRPQLTEAGRYHPITMLSLAPDETEEIWNKLPQLTGVNRVTGLRPGASALLNHPVLVSGQKPAPVVAVSEFGEGRVLAVTTDTTWHWDFVAGDSGGDNRHYYKFWGNAIRWLIRDPSLNPVQVEADRDRYPLGAEVALSTRVMGHDYTPAAGVDVTVVIRQLRDEAAGNESDAGAMEVTGKTDEAGQFMARIKPPRDGAWLVRASASLEGSPRDEDVFIVETDPVELRQTAARADTLKALSAQSGGLALNLDDSLEEAPRNEPRVLKVNRRKDVPVWANGWLLLLAVFLPSLEWYLRRRWGLL
jgi:uncharacterized membrane protein